MDRLQAALYHRRMRLLTRAFSGMRHPGLQLAEEHWWGGRVRRALSAWREHTVEVVAAVAASAVPAELVALDDPKRGADAAKVTNTHNAHQLHAPAAPRCVHFAEAGLELGRQARQLSVGAAALVATVTASLAGTDISGGDGSIVISLADLCVAQATASSRPVQEALHDGGLGSSGAFGVEGGAATRKQQHHSGKVGAVGDEDGSLRTFAAEEMASEWHRLRALHQQLLAWHYLPSTANTHGRRMGAAAVGAKRGGDNGHQDIPLRHDQRRAVAAATGRHLSSSRATSGEEATHKSITLSSAAAAGACRREALPTKILSRIPKARLWS